MKMKAQKMLFGVGLAVAALVMLGIFGWLARRPSAPAEETAGEAQPTAAATAETRAAAAEAAERRKPVAKTSGASVPKVVEPSVTAPTVVVDSDTEPKTAEDREEELVEAFDNLTDAWQDPAAKKVTIDEISRFHEQFNQVPANRKDECIHRALNLIPDENVMLLAGILLDTTQEKEILETVYGDILNRDEDVKRPILQAIFKDKTHPCWADTAWILDVTDDLPDKNTTDAR